jgi:hypothetical protein
MMANGDSTAVADRTNPHHYPEAVTRIITVISTDWQTAQIRMLGWWLPA